MNEAVWSAIGAGTLFGLSGGFSPGPLLVLVISETLRHGLRVGIMVAITPLLTDFPVMLVAILLLNQLTHFDLLLGGISLAGAVEATTSGSLSWSSSSDMSSVDILSSKVCTPRHANARVRTHGCTDVRALLSQLRAVYKQGLTDFLERLFELLQ